jgi:predicted dehydrogenase
MFAAAKEELAVPYRLGIIGAGNVADCHAQGAAAAGVEVAAVYDVDKQRAEAMAQRFDGCRACASLEQLLAMDDLPAVVAAVPNDLHKDTAIAVLRAGKDLLLEKPMAMTVAECDQIIAARDEAGRALQMGFVSRGAPVAVAVQRFIAEGRLGRIHHAKATMYRRRGIPGLGRWFTTRSRAGGGCLVDIGVHLLDLIIHLTGNPRPDRVSASCASAFGPRMEDYVYTEMWAGPPNFQGVFDVEDSANGLVRFDDGMTLDLSVAWAVNIKEQVLPDGYVLLGDRGGCVFDLWTNRLSIYTEQDGHQVDISPVIPTEDPWAAAWRAEHELFARIVTQGEAPSATGEQGRVIQQIVQSMYESDRAGQEVSIQA